MTDKPLPVALPCLAPGCTRPAVARGRCRSHYAQWYKSSAFKPVYLTGPRKHLVCTAPGCERPARTRDLCSMHYQRRWSHKWAEYQRTHRAKLKAEAVSPPGGKP